MLKPSCLAVRRALADRRPSRNGSSGRPRAAPLRPRRRRSRRNEGRGAGISAGGRRAVRRHSQGRACRHACGCPLELRSRERALLEVVGALAVSGILQGAARTDASGVLAEDTAAKLGKGAEAYVEGRLQLGRWQAQDGTQRSGLNVEPWKLEPIGQIGWRSVVLRCVCAVWSSVISGAPVAAWARPRAPRRRSSRCLSRRRALRRTNAVRPWRSAPNNGQAVLVGDTRLDVDVRPKRAHGHSWTTIASGTSWMRWSVLVSA